MKNFKSKLIIVSLLVLGITVFMRCSKENENNGIVDVSAEKSLQNQSIETAEQNAIAFRQNLISQVPVFEDVWAMKNFSFDESQLPSLSQLSSEINDSYDTITVYATDVVGNSYKIELTTLPYGLKSKNNGEKWRWPTANEWTCLSITLSGAIVSAGVGTFATVANFVAICAVEDKPKKVKVKGWYNGDLEFTFEEEVYEGEIGTHMNASLIVNEAGDSPIFVVKGLIKGENDNDVVFYEPFSSPQIEWNNIGNPGNLTSIPDHIYQLDNLYGTNCPYTLYSARNALLGELTRLAMP